MNNNYRYNLNTNDKEFINEYISKKLEQFRIDTDITNEELKELINIKDNRQIRIDYPIDKDINERIYLNELIRIFNILNNHKKTYNIEIKIKNRELLNKSNLLNYQNINLTIYNDYHTYTKEEYLSEEKQLDNLISSIKNANLSPYEKYLAVYNIVKQFKPYKENHEDKDKSRYLKYILNNEYIVCVGYSKLLTTLLNKLNIQSMEITADIDSSIYNDNLENIPTKLEGHQRNIVKIDDDKYNIHGIYIVDPTWDNNMNKDLYNNSTSTFDKRKEYKKLEKLTNEDLLLDFHNFNEFLEKINYYLKKSIYKKDKFFINDEHILVRIIRSYYEIYEDIMNLLYNLDYSIYQELYNKYNNQILDTENIYREIRYNQNNDISIKEIEDIFSNFLTDYATYIIPLSNQNINLETTLICASNIKKEIDKYNEEELKHWTNQTLDDNIEQQTKSFPYKYNHNDKRLNYLDDSSRTK